MANNVVNTTLLDIFVEFLETAIHTILYVRKIYPEEIFRRRQKYGVVLYQSIHPDLNSYITESLAGVKFFAKNNTLKCFALGIISEQKVYEKYNFELLNMEQTAANGVEFLVKLEQSLRDFCLRLLNSEVNSDKLPIDATFSLQIHTTEVANCELSNNPTYENFPWVKALNHEAIVHCSDIVPLCSIETDPLAVQVYIEKCAS